MAMFWTEAILCIMLVSLRFYARLAIRGLGADDWMMLFTVVRCSMRIALSALSNYVA